MQVFGIASLLLCVFSMSLIYVRWMGAAGRLGAALVS